jgi:hypothetical protein
LKNQSNVSEQHIALIFGDEATNQYDTGCNPLTENIRNTAVAMLQGIVFGKERTAN